MKELLHELARQRWDDHRYYHQCRINQSLHLLSALSFVAAYGLLFVDPALAAILAWCVAMVTRQAGHFFFEPRGYDHVNAVSDEHKEAVKVGYNIRRKVVLMTVWLAMPVLLCMLRQAYVLMCEAMSVETEAVLREVSAWSAEAARRARRGVFVMGLGVGVKRRRGRAGRGGGSRGR